MRKPFVNLLAAWHVSVLSATTALSEGRPISPTFYPAFGDQVLRRELGGSNVIEMFRDKGLVVELTVRCSRGAGVITYSKVEKLFCAADHVCSQGLQQAVSRTCR